MKLVRTSYANRKFKNQKLREAILESENNNMKMSENKKLLIITVAIFLSIFTACESTRHYWGGGGTTSEIVNLSDFSWDDISNTFTSDIGTISTSTILYDRAVSQDEEETVWRIRFTVINTTDEDHTLARLLQNYVSIKQDGVTLSSRVNRSLERIIPPGEYLEGSYLVVLKNETTPLTINFHTDVGSGQLIGTRTHHFGE